MPKEATRLQIDFSSLLGPLFFEWLMQLLLPVFVFSQVHEKEQSLRVMMKVQGLPDRSAHHCILHSHPTLLPSKVKEVYIQSQMQSSKVKVLVKAMIKYDLESTCMHVAASTLMDCELTTPTYVVIGG